MTRNIGLRRCSRRWSRPAISGASPSTGFIATTDQEEDPMRLRCVIAAFAACLVGSIAAAQVPAPAPAPTPLRVIAFDGGWNLPIWAAPRQGFFEANGVSMQLA